MSSPRSLSLLRTIKSTPGPPIGRSYLHPLGRGEGSPYFLCAVKGVGEFASCLSAVHLFVLRILSDLKLERSVDTDDDALF